MKFDDEDNYFKVEDARCEEGRLYELKFDQSLAMLEKSLDSHGDGDDDDDDD